MSTKVELKQVLDTLALPLADTRAAMSFSGLFPDKKFELDEEVSIGQAGVIAVWKRLRDLKIRDQEQYAILKHFGEAIADHVEKVHGEGLDLVPMALQILDNRLVGLNKANGVFDLSKMDWNKGTLPKNPELAVGLAVDGVFNRLVAHLFKKK